MIRIKEFGDFELKKFYRSIFSVDEINTGRQFEFDMAKAMILLCLPFIHLVIQLCSDASLEGGLPYLFDTIIGGPLAAPVFMFAMGFGMNYARIRKPRHYVMHAVGIGIAGIILNVFRFLIPMLIGYFATKNYDYYLEPLPGRMLTSDIFQFAFFALIIIAIFVKFNVSKKVMLLIGFISLLIGNIPVLIGQPANDIDTGNYVLNMLLGYFIPTEDHTRTIFSDFPVFSWLIIPICGYVFGSQLLKVKNKDKFYAIFTPICLVASIIYFYFGIKYEHGMFGEGQNCYYHIRIEDALICIVAAIAVLGVYHFLGKILPMKFKGWIETLSKVLTPYYCVHWVLVIVISQLFLFNFGAPHGDYNKVGKVDFISIGWVMFIGLCIDIVGIATAFAWKKYRARKAFGFNK